jgi:deoxyribodipyrimidine photolyase-related protein
MPGYQEQNHFGHERELPHYYWDGDTRMACMAHAIGQSLDHAYAHHIQRLMVTGNFALLAGIDPDAVDHWYLGIYIDAIQWVELPNTRGMSQYADGGLVASKPYCASGNYINRMSDYCGHCPYDVKRKTGAGSCPFNSLYWHFMARNREALSRNPRLGMTYRTWDRMDEGLRGAVLRTAEACLEDIENL